MTFAAKRQLTWLFAIGLSALYMSIYVLLDRVSYIYDLNHSETTPWAPGVAFLVMVVGSLVSRRYVPEGVGTTMLRMHAPDALGL